MGRPEADGSAGPAAPRHGAALLSVMQQDELCQPSAAGSALCFCFFKGVAALSGLRSWISISGLRSSTAALVVFFLFDGVHRHLHRPRHLPLHGLVCLGLDDDASSSTTTPSTTTPRASPPCGGSGFFTTNSGVRSHSFCTGTPEGHRLGLYPQGGFSLSPHVFPHHTLPILF